MIRFLLILIGLFIILTLVYRLMSAWLPAKKHKKESLPSKMVQCDYCQLYITPDDAVKSNSKYFCTMEHLKLTENSEDTENER